jgi:hypothetical protein
MKAHYRKPAVAIELSGTRPAPPTIRFGLTDAGPFGGLFQRARALLHVQANQYELGTVHTLDNHMLTDIGLEADALRWDKPNHWWPQ